MLEIRPITRSLTPNAWNKNLYVLTFSAEASMHRLKDIIHSNDHVEFAELNEIPRLAAQSNDTKFSNQYSHDFSHMDSQFAWNLEKGDDSVIVAIIDTGVDWDHPDLQGNLWFNSAEDANSNGVFDLGDLDNDDDDGNGYEDDVIGYDLFDGDGNPAHSGLPAEDNHGTKMAGVIAAVTNNGLGVAGIAGGWGASQPGCQMMILRVGDEDTLNGEAIVDTPPRRWTPRSAKLNFWQEVFSCHASMIESLSWRPFAWPQKRAYRPEGLSNGWV
jgi:subtilisin family serine protease